ncbi:16S rRNA (uracil(1498)-N(3))-methyltransferase [Psychrobacter alimentarius]|uniref:16S rRNA (uracil(1498)-N(3))-methyltransferase n=1 Tax=Psychrobacter alimentarius TaxID=261164 RepID=UPI003FCF1359
MRRFFYAISDDINTDKDIPYSRLDALSIGASIELTDSIVHHWCRVLRANVGDQGILFDGFGGEYQVQLQTISKKHATATLLSHLADDRSSSVMTQIGLVMSRGERMDYAIQKSTELGVTAIQLLSSHHGEVNLKPAQVEKKLAHWQQVAIAACEQCGLNRPPLVISPLSIEDWLSNLSIHSSNLASAVSPIVATLSQDPYYQVLQHSADLRMQLSVPAAGQPDMPESLPKILKQQTSYIQLLIGPEGGLSNDECKQALETGFEPWQIGTRVLRTETAPVVALATMHVLSL